MRSTNLLAAVGAALYSPKFYREVRQSWFGRSFIYLLVLLAICWLFVALTKTTVFWRDINKTTKIISEQLPVIHFSHGVAATSQPGPFYLKWSGNKSLVAIIDTHNKITNFRDSQAQFIVKKRSIIFKPSEHEINTYYFHHRMHGDFGPKHLTAMLSKHKTRVLTVSYLINYLFGLIYSYACWLLWTLLVAGVGWLFTIVIRRRQLYSAVLSLAIVSLTPAIILQTILRLTAVNWPWLCWGLLLLSLAYLLYAILASLQGPTHEQS